jgi:hypothetical protein
LHFQAGMEKTVTHLFIILGLAAGISSCKAPDSSTETAGSVVRESLGVLGTVKAIHLTSAGLSSSISEGYSEAELDFDSGVASYHLACPGKEFSGQAPVPRGLRESLQQFLSESEICRIRFEAPQNSERVACLAMMIPMAEAVVPSGEVLPLFLAGNPVCQQPIIFFCDPEVEKEFQDLAKKAIALLPACD